MNVHGYPVEANAAARELLEVADKTTREDLSDAVKARVDHPRWKVTRIQAAGQRDDFLVMARSWTGERVAAQIAQATARWTLTPRQREVLAKIAEGNANQTIAAMLGIAERTVEVHVTALFEKAQVECRAELVAKVYTLE